MESLHPPPGFVWHCKTDVPVRTSSALHLLNMSRLDILNDNALLKEHHSVVCVPAFVSRACFHFASVP